MERKVRFEREKLTDDVLSTGGRTVQSSDAKAPEKTAAGEKNSQNAPVGASRAALIRARHSCGTRGIRGTDRSGGPQSRPGKGGVGTG